MLLRSNHSLIHSLKFSTLLLAATAATALCAYAGTDETSNDKQKNVIEKPVQAPKFYVEVGAAGEFDYHATKFISNGSADFGVVGAYSLPAKIESRDFSSTHDVATIDGRFNFGYIVNPFVTVYAGFIYSHADGDNSRRLGLVTDTSGAFGAVGGRYDLYGDVGQYQAYTGVLGTHLTLPRTILDAIHAPQFIKPFFNLEVGGKYVEQQHVRFYSGGVNAVDTTINLYGDSAVFTVRGGFGYELKLARYFSINIDTDYGFDTKPGRGDRTLNGPNNTGFNGINNSGDRFYESVGVSAVFKF